MFLAGFFDTINGIDTYWDFLFTGERNVIGIILGFVRAIGVALALIIITIMAIRMLSKGDRAPEMQAETKKAFQPFLIGLIIFLAGTEIIEIIIDLVIYAWT